MSQLSVLLVFGGESTEHDISLLSADNVRVALDPQKYNTSYLYIDKSGVWWLQEAWSNKPETATRQKVVIVPGEQKIVTYKGTSLHVDVMIPILHGTNGEDGAIQGLAQMAHIPYVGPSLLGASLTMNKDVTKRLLRDGGVPVIDWVVWYRGSQKPEYKHLKRQLGETLFVKPANGGSSIGVSKVRNQEQLEAALDEAAKYDLCVLIEQAAGGHEVQISVLGNQNPKLTDICEIESAEDFHDFEDKYSKTSKVQFHVPARLSKQQTERIKNYASQAYTLTAGWGMARIDFFVNGKKIYLNEINSIPGFTNVSVYPMLWQKHHMSQRKLLDQLINLALE